VPIATPTAPPAVAAPQVAAATCRFSPGNDRSRRGPAPGMPAALEILFMNLRDPRCFSMIERMMVSGLILHQ
jgi:hypothetical protein